MTALPRKVAVIGAGEIGCGWAALCASAGWPVTVFDASARTLERASVEVPRRARALVALERATQGIVERGLLEFQQGRSLLQAVKDTDWVIEAIPEDLIAKQKLFAAVEEVAGVETLITSSSSGLPPSEVFARCRRQDRCLVAHPLNPPELIPLVEVVPGPRTTAATVERTLRWLERLGKTPVRCADSPGFIGPRIQVLLMNEAVRLVEEGVATPEDVDRAFRAGMGFRYASIGIFEFIDWGGVDILYRASRYMSEALGDERFKPARLVERKMAYNELGPKTGRGFFDYTGERRDTFETAKIRALLRQLKRDRESPP